MVRKVFKICTWASIPVLLASGIFTHTAGFVCGLFDPRALSVRNGCRRAWR
jgi:hypothetical protein